MKIKLEELQVGDIVSDLIESVFYVVLGFDYECKHPCRVHMKQFVITDNKLPEQISPCVSLEMNQKVFGVVDFKHITNLCEHANYCKYKFGKAKSFLGVIKENKNEIHGTK